jgi:hypothetical protein
VVNAVSAPGRIHGRVLWFWSLALGGWTFVQVLQLASTWPQRAVGLAVSAAFAAGMALFVRAGFRRATAHPLATRGTDGWLACRPWLSAVVICAVYLAIPAGVFSAVALHFHRFPRANGLVIGIFGEWFLLGLGTATFWVLVWRQQRRATNLPG